MLTEAQFSDWLARYRTAWETQDPAAAMALFTADATYRETPFDPPGVGRAAIGDYWRDRVGAQANIRFSFGVLAVAGDAGFARWRSELDWMPGACRLELEGIFRCTFRAAGADAGLCDTLEEWWHRRDLGPIGGK
jgi:hypothetical protein